MCWSCRDDLLALQDYSYTVTWKSCRDCSFPQQVPETYPWQCPCRIWSRCEKSSACAWLSHVQPHALLLGLALLIFILASACSSSSPAFLPSPLWLEEQGLFVCFGRGRHRSTLSFPHCIILVNVGEKPKTECLKAWEVLEPHGFGGWITQK